MANITKRGGTYRVRVLQGRDAEGRQIFASATFAPDPNRTGRQNQKALNEFAVDFERRVKGGGYLSGDRMTYGEFVEEHWKPYAAGRLAVTTYESDLSALRLYILPLLGALKIQSILPLHVQDMCAGMSKKGLSAGYITRVHSTLSRTLAVAKQWRLVDGNAAQDVKPPKAKKSPAGPKCLDLEQTKAFLDFIEKPYIVVLRGRRRKDGSPSRERTMVKTVQYQLRVLYNLGIFAALRRGEMIALQWGDVDFDNNSVSVTKSTARTKGGQVDKDPKNESSARVVSLPPAVMKMLRQHKKEQAEFRMKMGAAWRGSGHLFTKCDGSQMGVCTPNAALKKIIARYNSDPSRAPLPPVCLHATRHTSATLSIAAGMDVKSVSARLGHADASTTLDIYAHALKSMDEKIASALEDMLAKKA